MSRYNLDVADVANQRARFDLFDAEARAMVAQRLPLPAYDNLLKTSQAFNMLDARGAVGVTERAELFARMRTLAREVSKLWLDRREELARARACRPADFQPAATDSGAAAAARRASRCCARRPKRPRLRPPQLLLAGSCPRGPRRLCWSWEARSCLRRTWGRA